jgi:hypothetical protein
MKPKNAAGNSGKESTNESIADEVTKIVPRTPTHEEIRLRAYEIFLHRGGVHGLDEDDWLKAERELSGRSS